MLRLSDITSWEVAALRAIKRAGREARAGGGDSWVQASCIPDYQNREHYRINWLNDHDLVARKCAKSRLMRITRRGIAILDIIDRSERDLAGGCERANSNRGTVNA